MFLNQRAAKIIFVNHVRTHLYKVWIFFNQMEIADKIHSSVEIADITASYSFNCPHCTRAECKFTEVLSHETIRSYGESPSTRVKLEMREKRANANKILKTLNEELEEEQSSSSVPDFSQDMGPGSPVNAATLFKLDKKPLSPILEETQSQLERSGKPSWSGPGRLPHLADTPSTLATTCSPRTFEENDRLKKLYHTMMLDVSTSLDQKDMSEIGN